MGDAFMKIVENMIKKVINYTVDNPKKMLLTKSI